MLTQLADSNFANDSPFLIFQDLDSRWTTRSWREMGIAVAQRIREAESLRGRRVGLVMRTRDLEVVWLLALLELEAFTVLLPSDASEQYRSAIAEQLRLDCVIDGDFRHLCGNGPSAATRQGAQIVILTSGTTGQPKPVVHSWASITRPVKSADALRGSRWLLAYAPHLYAGLQVFCHALLNQGTLVMLPQQRSPELAATAIGEFAINYISATPSFWRCLFLALTREQQGRFDLKQITLGGEIADQTLLDRLRAAFPAARIIHIYATTELGRCFSVTDGKAGFPARFLEGVTADGIEMKVEENELLVRSANRAIGYASGTTQTCEHDSWIRTGDVVEIVGDRVVFRGRTTEVANVGGHKVSPLAVEDFLRSLPEVEDALVYSMASSITGQLLGCDLVLKPGLDPDLAKKAIIQKSANSPYRTDATASLESYRPSNSLLGRKTNPKKGTTRPMNERRHVILSGGTRGLGKVLLGALLKQNYAVSTFSRNPGVGLEEWETGYPLLVQAADVADPHSLDIFMDQAVKEFGRPFGLINNAGIAVDGVLATMRTEQIHQVLSVNLEGTLLLSRAVIRRMLVGGDGGSIVNISSIIGLRGYSGLAVYSATKAGIDGMTRALARELGSRRIRVNSIAPGYLETEMTHGLSEQQRLQIVRRTPMNRLGTPEDVIELVLFLLSAGSGFVTGQTIAVDGGVTC